MCLENEVGAQFIAPENRFILDERKHQYSLESALADYIQEFRSHP